MFVGEIGISRHEFLYDIQFWEARRIIQGYENRNRTLSETTRLAAFYALFAMRENKNGTTPRDLITFPWEHDTQSDIPDEDEIAELQQELAMLNAKK